MLDVSCPTFFPRQQQVITDVAIHTNFIADLYAVLGDNRNNHDKASVYVLRLHFNPLAPRIWIGGFIMILGGIITLIDLCANKNNKKIFHAKYGTIIMKSITRRRLIWGLPLGATVLAGGGFATMLSSLKKRKI